MYQVCLSLYSTALISNHKVSQELLVNIKRNSMFLLCLFSQNVYFLIMQETRVKVKVLKLAKELKSLSDLVLEYEQGKGGWLRYQSLLTLEI